MHLSRSSGLLCPVTSLPGPYGIGDLGDCSLRFLDDLVRMGQRYWQILPDGVTGYGDSPYQSFSSFAGNPLWISLDALVATGHLDADSLSALHSLPKDFVDYGSVVASRRALLGEAARHFIRSATAEERRAYKAFRSTHARWLDDYALFMAIKRAHGDRPWTEWPASLRRRETRALSRARRSHAAVIDALALEQFWFDQQWRVLREAAHARGIRIIGDIPIFVAHDSADAWCNPALFHLDESGHCPVVAGVPPDYFSATGQRWGNPLYRWEEHARTGYRWWADRLRGLLKRVDWVRIDHFRGFESYWEVPGDAPDASGGCWKPGPGDVLFQSLEKQLGPLPILAEDLGIITPAVEALRDRLGFPGMRVLQFMFGDDSLREMDDPARLPANRVIYTGTHDNDTTRGWYNSQPGVGNTATLNDLEALRHRVRVRLGCDGSEIHWDFIRVALASPAVLSIIPVQDVLGLGSEARLNTPGTTSGNWRWRMGEHVIPVEATGRLRELTRIHGRSAIVPQE